MRESATPLFLKKSTRASSRRFLTGNEPNVSECFQLKTPTTNTHVLVGCQPRSFAGARREPNSSRIRRRNRIRATEIFMGVHKLPDAAMPMELKSFLAGSVDPFPR